jgi:hypothetical protein
MRKSRLIIFILVALFGGTAAAYAAAHKQAHSKVTGASGGAIAVANNPVLLGNTALGATSDSNSSNDGQAWLYTAAQSGTVSDVQTYITSGDAATWLTVGLYSTSASKPSTLVSAGSARVKKGAWNDITIGSAKIVAGTKYAVAILGTGGAVGFRDTVSGSCNTWTSSSASLKALPAKWSTGVTFTGYCPASIYVNGTTGTTTSTTSTSSTSTTQTTTTVAPPPVTTTTSTSTTSTSTTSGGTTPPGATSVGTAAAAKPSCTTTVALNGDVTSALSGAATGATVCLASGTWNAITISSTPKTGVTLASATPGAAKVAGVTISASTSNLTIEGLSLNDSILVHNAVSGLAITDNTMENWGSGSGDAQLDSAVYIYPQYDGSSSSAATNVAVTYNQMDHIPQCEQVSSEGPDPTGMTYSHNVCGPDIGNNEPNDVHYLQMEGESNQVVDNNAFVGPPAPDGTSHLNVLHSCGSNLEFNNNIIWHAQGLAQSLLYGDDCTTTDTRANNNLFVEDPSGPHQYSMWINNEQSSSGVTFSNNTIYNHSDYGAMLAQSVPGFVAHNNVVDAISGYSFSGGTESSNAGQGGDVSWTPAWQSTSWTPNSGAPWAAPPANYYKPSGIASTFGYQGTIGP